MSAYRGRFAPSPTGPLHFGSLVAAMASYVDAKANNGQWLVRIEDLDTPRTVPGEAGKILHTLESFGFQWDEAVVYQSDRNELYRDALERLSLAGLVYPCGCSRKELDDGIYPGTCRNGLNGRTARSWRIRVEGCIRFNDRVQGPQSEDLAQQSGDFVLLRADGAWAYQLAVVVDDAAQGITNVIRGADLLTSTPRQIYLQRQLRLPEVSYLHVPVAVDEHGQKLSKQTHAQPLDPSAPIAALAAAAVFLGHPVPRDLAGCPVTDFWEWLITNWSITRIPAVKEVRLY